MGLPFGAIQTPGKFFIVDADLRNFGVGAVPSQEIDEQVKVQSYFKAREKYCLIRRELLAVVDTIKPFHKYLYGQVCSCSP